MSRPQLIIGGIVVPHLAALEITQTFRAIKSVSARRMGSGRLHRQKHWRKWATTIRIPTAWLPAGLDTLDFDDDLEVACIEPLHRQSVVNAITLPAARRSDVDLRGFAIVGKQIVRAEVNLVGNVATVTPVAGATAYRVEYFPLLICAVDLQEELDASRAVYAWTLECEEV